MQIKNQKLANTFFFSSIENDSAAFVKSFRQDGFAVVKNIFDDQVSTELRGNCISIVRSAGGR